jgi:glycerol-3-phosphate acyltransferase PlsY
MFCYIYCDYFELYAPGKLDSMLQGNIGPLGATTQGVLLGTSLLMAVPSLMIALSVALPARYNRIVNIVIGAFFTLLLVLLTYSSAWYFYKVFAAIETVLTASVVRYAWKWPKTGNSI